jgi:peptidoglycan/xylan/chitin deacetylase (PgdA/CDA1 family)
MNKLTCITVDVDRIDQFNSEKVRNLTETILDLFSEFNVRGTFFVCGESVSEHQDIVKWIAEEHEVAAHGYFHRNLRQIKTHELRQEIRMAHEAFEKIGVECVGFRCPHLVVPPHLGPILSENKFIYDSSQIDSLFIAQRLVFPFTRMKVDGIIEIPIQTFTALRLPLSLSSLRLLGPKRFAKYLPDTIDHFYFHLWEFDRMGSSSGDTSWRSNTAHQVRMKKDLLKGYWDFLTGQPTSPADLTGRNTGEEAIKIVHILLKELAQRGTRFVTCAEWAKPQITSTELL